MNKEYTGVSGSVTRRLSRHGVPAVGAKTLEAFLSLGRAARLCREAFVGADSPVTSPHFRALFCPPTVLLCERG